MTDAEPGFFHRTLNRIRKKTPEPPKPKTVLPATTFVDGSTLHFHSAIDFSRQDVEKRPAERERLQQAVYATHLVHKALRDERKMESVRKTGTGFVGLMMIGQPEQLISLLKQRRSQIVDNDDPYHDQRDALTEVIYAYTPWKIKDIYVDRDPLMKSGVLIDAEFIDTGDTEERQITHYAIDVYDAAPFEIPQTIAGDKTKEALKYIVIQKDEQIRLVGNIAQLRQKAVTESKEINDYIKDCDRMYLVSLKNIRYEKLKDL